ncbi:MAG: HD domain-containing protein [Alloprevotella sp.]|nr:HD domain-containing protein [Alloprevotella sp.]
MDPISLINKYYADNEPLRELLLLHSRQVTQRALEIARRHPALPIDCEFVEQAAMLHDIGIFLTDAPGIHCHGTQPYLLHGRLGAELMRQEGLERVARVCERHTGTGLTPEVIARQNLPLPPGDYRPETLEEQLICYADKFFSKSHPERVRSIADTARSLEKFGAEGVAVFLGWAKLFDNYTPCASSASSSAS